MSSKCNDWFSSEAFKTNCLSDALLLALFKIPGLSLETYIRASYKESQDVTNTDLTWLNKEVLDKYKEKSRFKRFLDWYLDTEDETEENEVTIIWNNPNDDRYQRINKYRAVLQKLVELIDMSHIGNCGEADRVTKELRQNLYDIGFLKNKDSYSDDEFEHLFDCLLLTFKTKENIITNVKSDFRIRDKLNETSIVYNNQDYLLTSFITKNIGVLNYKVYVKNPCNDEWLVWDNNNSVLNNNTIQKATVLSDQQVKTTAMNIVFSMFVAKSKIDEIKNVAQPVPAQPVPAQPTPAQPTPAQPTPVQATPVQTTPVQTTPAQVIPPISQESQEPQTSSENVSTPNIQGPTSQAQSVTKTQNDVLQKDATNKLKEQLNVLQTRSTKDVSLYVPPDTTDIIKNVLQNLPPNILDGRESALTIVEVEEKKDCLMYVEVDTSKPPVNVMKMGTDGDNTNETINYKVKNEPSTAAKVYKLNFSDVANVGVGGMCMIKYKDEILCTYLKVKPDGWIMLNNFVDVNANDTNSIYIQTVGQFTINGLRINSN